MAELPQSPTHLKGKRVLVLGLGTKGGGTEVVKWLVAHGAAVTVTDKKTSAELQPAFEELRALPVRYVLGEHREQDIQTAELIVRNPAVPKEAPELAIAARAGVPVVMDTTLFFLFCPAPIGGVTGTRGKSTTTAVAGEILRRSRPETVVAGNIQRSPLADLDRITPATPVVLELSSWQLEGIEPLKRSPHWAVLTTILPDHLNRYPDMDAYVASKEPMVKDQRDHDVVILPIDDPWGARFSVKTSAQRRWFGTPSDFTVIRITVKYANERLSGLFRIGDRVVRLQEGREDVLLSWNELGGIGDHTKRNMIAGALLALEMGAPVDDARAVLREFRGLPNRLETIREFAGRTFVNDTTATTPDAVIAALRAFAPRRVVLVTGGTDKNLEYRGLADELRRATHLRATVLLSGSATEKLLAAWPEGRESVQVRDMAAAVGHAWRAAQNGDVILLSPGAASFELFRDEFDRGQQFREAVLVLRDSKE